MNRVAGVFKMHWRDKWVWLLIPWTICLSSFLVNWVIGALLKPEEGVYTGGIASIVVYVFVAGTITLSQTFPFALGMGVRRTDYFLGTAAMSVLTSFVTSVLLILLSLVEKYWTNGWGVDLHFFNLPFVNEGPVVLQAGAYFFTLLHMYFLGFVIASIHRKFGRTGMFVLFPVVFLSTGVASLLITQYDRWDDIGRWVEGNFHTVSDVTPWLLPFVLLYALVSYGLLRRSTV